MSVSLTCDGCGVGISLEALRRGLALEHQGTHYCERCKAPILSFLKRRQSPPNPSEGAVASSKEGKSPSPPAKSGGKTVVRPAGRPPAPAAAPPGPFPGAASRPANPLGDLEGGDLDAELEELASKNRASQPPPQDPRPQGGLRREPAGSAGRAGVSSRALSPASPSKAASLPGAPIPPSASRKPGVEAGSRAPGGPVAGQLPPRHPGGVPGVRVVKPAPWPESEEGEAPRPAARKRALILGAMGAGTAALLILTGVLWISSGSPEAVAPRPPVPLPDVQAELAKAAEETRRKALLDEETRRLAKFRESLSDDPEKLFSLRSGLEVYLPPSNLVAEYRQLLGDVERRLVTAADRAFQEVLKRSDEYQKQEKFTAAGELWKSMPEVVRRTELRSKWKEEEGKAERYARAWALWTKLDAKADKYLGQDDAEISVAILSAADNYPHGCNRLYPLIWKKREDRIRNIQLNAESERLARAERAAEREREEEEKERVRLEGVRRQRWAALVQEAPWVPLISHDASDLENWTHRSWIGTSLEDVRIPWSVQLSDGKAVILGNNPTDQRDIEIGMNGNRWIDWVLEFEVKVEAGTLALKTRAVLRGEGTYNTRVVEDGESPKDFEFPAQAYGSWKKVRIEAQGKKVTWIVDGEKKLEAETSGRQNGGFVFVLKPRSAARIQDVRLKLIFDEKREKDDSDSEEEN